MITSLSHIIKLIHPWFWVVKGFLFFADMGSCEDCRYILENFKISHACREHANCIVKGYWDPSQCENCQSLICDMHAESIPNDSSRFLLGWIKLINNILSALPSSKPGDSVFANPDLAENIWYKTHRKRVLFHQNYSKLLN